MNPSIHEPLPPDMLMAERGHVARAAVRTIGLRQPLQALALPHPGLPLDTPHTVMAGFDRPFSLIGPALQIVFGRPLHAVAELGVDA